MAHLKSIRSVHPVCFASSCQTIELRRLSILTACVIRIQMVFLIGSNYALRADLRSPRLPIRILTASVSQMNMALVGRR